MQRSVPSHKTNGPSGGVNAAPEAPPRQLGSKRGSPAPTRVERRATVWAAAEYLREHSSLPSVACCRLTAIDTLQGATVKMVGVEGVVAGLRRCSSPWSCPACAARIGSGRADQLTGSLTRWLAAGNSAAMATMTMRHGRRDRLSDLWDAKSAAWANVRMSKAMRALPDLAGYIQKTEVTWGANGWHLHIHALVLFRCGQAGLKDASRAWERTAWPIWQAALAKPRYRHVDAGYEGPAERFDLTPSQEHGMDVARVRPGNVAEDVARYVAKDGTPAESLQAVAHELAGGTTKLAGAGNLNQWGLLAAAMGGDRQAQRLFGEWEAVSKGRRQLVPPRGDLRDELGWDDLADDDLTEDSPEGVGLVAVHEDSWKSIRRQHAVPELLGAVEDAYRRARWVDERSHFDSLGAAQDAACFVLAIRGVPAHHVRDLALPQPAAPAPSPDVVTPGFVQLVLG